MEALTPIFLIIFFAQIIWGFGYTFISGALDSWVSDEIETKLMEHTIITGSQMNKLFSVIGIFLAAVIGMYNIRLAIYVSGSLFILLVLYSSILMKENKFYVVPHKQTLYKEYFSQLIRGIQSYKIK
ncbi:MAG: hypothetical protein ACOCV1_02820 [Bacillota bacterium]